MLLNIVPYYFSQAIQVLHTKIKDLENMAYNIKYYYLLVYGNKVK